MLNHSQIPRPVFGIKGEPLKFQQVYYCVQATCPKFKKQVLSWLTVDDARRLVDPHGLKCQSCHAPLKWIRSQALYHPE